MNWIFVIILVHLICGLSLRIWKKKLAYILQKHIYVSPTVSRDGSQSMFRRFYVPKVLYFEGFMFRMSIDTTLRHSGLKIMTQIMNKVDLSAIYY